MKTIVLVLDDNAAVQAIIAAALGPLGIDVVSGLEGATALERIRELAPSIVFLSNTADGTEAEALCRVIKLDDTLKAISLIFMSSTTEGEDVEKAILAAGADHVVRKPFKSGEVRSLIESCRSSTKKEPQKVTRNSTPQTNSVVLQLEDEITQSILQSFLAAYGIDSLTPSDASTRETTPSCYLLDTASFAAHEKQLTGINQPIYIIAKELDTAAKKRGCLLIQRPLSEQKLKESLKRELPAKRPSSAEEVELETGEQALLSAQISAHIYQRLLLSEPLKHRKWREVAASVGAETLHQCQNWEKD